MATGGAVSNTGQALHKLGIQTRLMAKVGDDVFGRATLRLLQSLSANLADGMRISNGEASSYTIILNPPRTDRIFLHCPGPNATFGADDIDYDLLAKTDLFHFGYPPVMMRLYQNDGAELVKLFKKAKATGVTTSLDLAMPDPNAPSGQANWRHILQATLPYVDLFVPSLDEILLILHPATFQQVSQDQTQITATLLADIAAELLEMGAKIVLLKIGERGLYLRTANQSVLSQLGRSQPDDVAVWANREMLCPIFETSVAGTTGAGDAAIAGFLAVVLQNLSPDQALTFAAAVGACNVEAPDATSGILSWEQTWARVEAGWSRQLPAFATPGWREGREGIWIGPADAANLITTTEKST
jgi:sugar/nucleoside kinase (ribokinase family)